MNKIIYYLLYLFLFFFSTNIFASVNEYNTESNIKKAVLIQDYIVRHKIKIEKFITKYNIKSDNNLNSDIQVLNESILALKKIQNTNIKKKNAEEIIQAILVRIKNVNESLKTKLKNEKKVFEKKLNKKKLVYAKLWIKLSKKIDNINIKIATNIFKNKRILNLKESKIKLNLIKLNKESINLKNFWSIEFKSEKEIKDRFINILTNIKKEISLMKNELN